MIFGEYPYKYDVSYFNNYPSFFGLYIDDILVGVNSGHKTGDSYRSRGLYVFPDYRGNSFGKQLLDRTVKQAVAEESTFCWSLPRFTSFNTYASANFEQFGDWFGTETSDKNAYATVTTR
jgi:GNAT superfamily N-acetyltransferase